LKEKKFGKRYSRRNKFEMVKMQAANAPPWMNEPTSPLLP